MNSKDPMEKNEGSVSSCSADSVRVSIDPAEEQMIDSVRRWVERVVVNLGLCPFAGAALDKGGVHYVSAFGHPDRVVEVLAHEFGELQARPELETTLLVLDRGYPEFTDYLDLVDACEGQLIDLGLEGEFQLASFHPSYQFEGTGPDDVENYTNRSPSPVIQILREASVSEALEAFNQPELIPQYNIAKMQDLGLAEMQRLVDSCQGN